MGCRGFNAGGCTKASSTKAARTQAARTQAARTQAARFEAHQACCPRGEDEHACKAPSAERQGSDGRSAIKGAYTKAEAEQATHK